ncbi:MAG: class I SAM-dependent methyltransferase [Terrimicrobiaceae bacterium]
MNKNDKPIATPEWNDEMYRSHATPYTGLAGFIEERRVQSILAAARISAADSILEIGCEAGNLLFRFPACKRTVGFDISPAALSDAGKLFAGHNKAVELIQGDASLPLPFERGDFSVIVCSEMLEHVPDPHTCVARLAELVDEKTRVILTVPDEMPKLRIKSILQTFGLMKVLFPRIEAEQSAWHLQQFDKQKLLSVCEQRLHVVSVRSIWGLHWIAECCAIA